MYKHKNLIIFFALAISQIYLKSALANIYACETANGNVTYQDFPCRANMREKFHWPKQADNKKRSDTKGIALSNLKNSVVIVPDGKIIKLKSQTPLAKYKERQKNKKAQKRRLKCLSQCYDIDNRIKMLHDKLRHGYTAQQKHKIDLQLSRLQALKATRCGEACEMQK